MACARNTSDTRQKAISRRLRRLHNVVVPRAADGTLLFSFRWILGSSSTFLVDPSKDVLRPIRLGEGLSNIVAKTCLSGHRTSAGPRPKTTRPTCRHLSLFSIQVKRELVAVQIRANQLNISV